MTALALGIVWVTVACGVLAVGWTWVRRGTQVTPWDGLPWDVLPPHRREANRTRIVRPGSR